MGKLMLTLAALATAAVFGPPDWHDRLLLAAVAAVGLYLVMQAPLHGQAALGLAVVGWFGPPQWQPYVLGGVAALALGYLAMCMFWPQAACRRCGGKGRLTAPGDLLHARRCPRCKGDSWRPRWGRRIYGHLRPPQARDRLREAAE